MYVCAKICFLYANISKSVPGVATSYPKRVTPHENNNRTIVKLFARIHLQAEDILAMLNFNSDLA